MQEFNIKKTPRKASHSIYSDESVACLDTDPTAFRNSLTREPFNLILENKPRCQNANDFSKSKSNTVLNCSSKNSLQSKCFSSSSCDSDDSEARSETSNPIDTFSSEFENPRSRSLSSNKVDTLDNSTNYSLEAQANRKILDLEISNKSLNAINQIFESKLVHRAAEIKELKKRISALSFGNTTTPISKKNLEFKSEEGDEQIQRLSDRIEYLIDAARSTLSSPLDNITNSVSEA